MASHARPPIHHPTVAHAAIAGVTSSNVCSIGTSGRNTGTSGMSNDSRSAKTIFAHPRSLTAVGAALLDSGVPLVSIVPPDYA